MSRPTIKGWISRPTEDYLELQERHFRPPLVRFEDESAIERGAQASKMG
jgi:hypothetical protein